MEENTLRPLSRAVEQEVPVRIWHSGQSRESANLHSQTLVQEFLRAICQGNGTIDATTTTLATEKGMKERVCILRNPNCSGQALSECPSASHACWEPHRIFRCMPLRIGSDKLWWLAPWTPCILTECKQVSTFNKGWKQLGMRVAVSLRPTTSERVASQPAA